LGDDDAGKTPAGQRPVPALEVEAGGLDAGHGGQPGKCRRVAVDRENRVIPGGEQAGMAAAAAGQIEHAAAGGNPRAVRLDPQRRRYHRRHFIRGGCHVG
jgi:hypothetical protein